MAMLLGRYLFRDSAKKMAQKYRVINAIDKVMEKEGLKFTLLLRLCPLIPFNAFNYVMGVTAVTFKDYAIGGVGMIPGTIVYVFVGTTIGNIADAASGEFEGGTATLVLLIVGTVLAFVAIVYITIVVKRYLNKQLAEDAAEKESKEAENKTEEKKADAAGETGQLGLHVNEVADQPKDSSRGLVEKEAQEIKEDGMKKNEKNLNEGGDIEMGAGQRIVTEVPGEEKGQVVV